MAIAYRTLKKHPAFAPVERAESVIQRDEVTLKIVRKNLEGIFVKTNDLSWQVMLSVILHSVPKSILFHVRMVKIFRNNLEDIFGEPCVCELDGHQVEVSSIA